jgi:predicted nucleotidyltransferase
MTIKIKGNLIETTPYIEKVVAFLFSRINTSVHLYLIGSRARGDCTSKSDWDFAIDAGDPLPWNFFAVLRQEAADIAFPDEIDIVDLNRAPDWFRKSTKNDLIEILR